jgi:arylsulfatase A-like enzyme
LSISLVPERLHRLLPSYASGDGKSDLYENETPIQQRGYMTDLITDRAVRFITETRRPFFLEVAYSAAHWPFQPPDREPESPNNTSFQGPADSSPATRQDYISMVERADLGVGKILRSLDASARQQEHAGHLHQ